MDGFFDVEEQFRRLTEHRQGHIRRVADVMAKLAKIHGLDPDSAYWAGYGHDLAREMSRSALLLEASRWNLNVGPEEREEPVLLHGPIAAEWLKAFGVGSDEVYEAIRFHTTGGPGLGRLGKALFVADAIEPGRSFEKRIFLEKMAYQDLDKAYYAVIEETLTYLESRGITPHPRMVQALSENVKTH